VAKGWGPGTRERQHASRDTIPERWGERTHHRTQAQLSLNRSALAAGRFQLPTLASGVAKLPFSPFSPFSPRESTPDPRNRNTASGPDPRAPVRQLHHQLKPELGRTSWLLALTAGQKRKDAS